MSIIATTERQDEFCRIVDWAVTQPEVANDFAASFEDGKGEIRLNLVVADALAEEFFQQLNGVPSWWTWMQV